MKRTLTITLCLIALATTAFAEMGASRGHDLDALWKRAQDSLDLDTLDAALLLESRSVEVWPHGDLWTTVHRVVWIGTRAGLRAHADLRIPWNSDTSQLDVEVLRTWRDGRWWPSADTVSETAVVETLPHALGRCPDYAGMRETMLLHDGIELPCIMETAYMIITPGGAEPGADGVFVMAQREPAVRVEYRVTAPKIPLHARSFNGAPEPVIEGNTRAWILDDAPRLRLPTTRHAVRYEPTLMWSTWYDRGTMLCDHAEPLYDAAVIDEALTDSVSARVAGVRSEIARARIVVDMLAEGVRNIHYDDTHWARAPREAGRVWDTAYGHDRDRAVLALALFNAANLTADLQLVSTDGPLLADFPATALLDRTLVRIWDGDDTHLAVYDPARGGLLPASEQFGVWIGSETDGKAAVELHLSLTPTEEGDWTGSGYFTANEVLSPHILMAGTGTETADRLDSVLDGALDGATLTGHNPDRFTPRSVAMGLAFDFTPGEPDEADRIRIDLADLLGGLLDEMPPDVRLEDAVRESPVWLRDSMRQAMTLRIDLDGVSVAHAPESHMIDTGAGQFMLMVELTDETLVIKRRLVLSGGIHYPAASWPDLRALLLEEVDPANRVVMLKRD
jgi:hypothetical protein